MIDIRNMHLPLPEHTEGTKKEIQDGITLPTLKQAQTLYTDAKKRLLDINRWSDLCGNASATFELTDEKGNRIEGSPEVGLYFKIDVPGPGTASGKGFDWVKVEAIHEQGDSNTDTEYIIIRVRPASNPTTAKKNTAHFFSNKASSNFLVLRERLEVTAAVLGRNETANTDEDNGLFDKIRNVIVGTSAKWGMADPQWESLVEGILGKR